MPDVKWIRLSVDIFDNRKIKHIRRLEMGERKVLIWVYLLTLAGKCNSGGDIFITPGIPYSFEELADEIGVFTHDIEESLDIFESFGMLTCNNGVITITNWEEYQNAQGLDRIREQGRLRVQRSRQKKREQMESQICQYCGEPATGYDHIIPTSRGGTEDKENLVPCCKRCNTAKNNFDLVWFLNTHREFIKDELVLSNPKLTRYVTFSSVTNRYIVTQCNAIEEDIRIRNKKENIEPIERKKEGVKPKKERKKTYDELIAEYCLSDGMKDTIREFLKMRQLIKKPMTDRALAMLINRVRELAPDEETQKAILEQSITNSWANVYPLKENAPKGDFKHQNGNPALTYQQSGGLLEQIKKYEEAVKREWEVV